MSTNGTISRVFNPKTSQIDFTTSVGGCCPEFVAALKGEQVNLSRGHNRMYDLTNLSAHNNTGANWKDGREIHTPARMKEYLARCDADIAAAVERAKAAFTKAQDALFSTTPVTVASVSCS